MNIKRLTTLSMLIAINVVLCTLAPINLISFKFTFEAYPVLVAGLLLGPVDGLIVGGVGSLIYQLLFSGYGFTVTTILWVIPHACSGLLVGLMARGQKENLSFRFVSLCAIISALSVTTLNLVALYADAKVFGYYSDALLWASLPQKLIVGIILAVIYALTLPRLIEILKRFVIKEH